ncbi:hypothetical protein V5F22_03440 [Acinetobacter baumannii]|uniref:hypothetical protein n=1 Tax=Acinetobacter pittii TaxID=48296 RepID=UPI000D094C64|nr:hypothetical protein [Acinetobacter pittii]AVN19401.1 hypothetical protein C6N19_16530 [Acinetobacter pittii]MDC5565164.1 hypothetical protein [Acinetobacter baumannii]
MYYIITNNFELDKLPPKVSHNIFVTFAQYGDELQRMPIYSISDSLQGISLLKLAKGSWQILHFEHAGERRVFSKDSLPLLEKFNIALKQLNTNYFIEIKEQKIEFTESEGD